METTKTSYLSPNQILRKALFRNPWALIPMAWICLCILIALAAPFISPDKSKGTNLQIPSAKGLPPFSSVFLVTSNGFADTPLQFDSTFTSNQTRFFLRENTTILRIPQNNPYNIQQKFFCLGTDTLGRDLLSRLLHGTRVSLSIGTIAVLISVLLGLLLGSLGALNPKTADPAIQWLSNTLWAIPTLLLVMIITLLLGKGPAPVFIAVGLSMWVEVARIVRAEVKRLETCDFMLATKAMGFSSFQRIIKHIWPNVAGPVSVQAAANFAAAILVESGLSFMGLGIQPPTPTWGNMISSHRMYLLSGNPWPVIIPGLAIVSLVLSFTLISHALRNANSEA
jgi:peptide/nickel transport system permease protein